MLKWKDCPYSKAISIFQCLFRKALQIISVGEKIKDYVDSFGAPTNKARVVKWEMSVLISL